MLGFSFLCSATPMTEKMYHKSLSALQTPSLCPLKLICAIYQSENENLKSAPFMRGILVLSKYKMNQTNNHSLLFDNAVRAGKTGQSCSEITPDCPYSEKELVMTSMSLGVGDTTVEAEKRRERKARLKSSKSKSLLLSLVKKQRKTRARRHSMSDLNMPPLFRPEHMVSEVACQTCDQRSSICTVFGVGTSAGCFVSSLAFVPLGTICNVATAPVSIACGTNTLHCYIEHCGLV